MAMHSRQPSTSFAPPSKNQTITSSTHNSGMICSYPPSGMYSSASGTGASGSWPSNQRPPYNGVDSIVCQDQQRARWQAQHEATLRRERRLECSSLSPLPSSLHSHQIAHADGTNSPYPNSSQLLRASGYDGMYSRPTSADVHSPASSWNTWDMDASSAASPSNSYQRFGEDHSPWNSHINLDIPHLDSHGYDNILMSGSDSSQSSTLYNSGNDHTEHAIPLNGFSFPHRISPDAPSPSPSPVYHHQSKQTSSGSGPSPKGTRRNSEGKPDSGKSCSHCRATTTPLWRRDPSTMQPLCNACGLYLQQRNKLRPQELIDADDDGSSSEESDPNYVGPECSHCRTHRTSVWRRSKAGDQLCNACGVYARLRGKPRPLTLKKHKIRPRSKHTPK